MKLLLSSLLAFACFFSFGQDNFKLNNHIYKASVAQTTAQVHTGYIGMITDSAIYLTDNAGSIRYNNIDEKDLTKIYYNRIEAVVIKRKGAVGRGILGGALTGIVTGVVAGLMIGSDPPCTGSQSDLYGIGTALCNAFRTTAGEKALLLGGTGAIGGALIGGIIGGVARKRFVIGGKKEKFDAIQLSGLERTYGTGNN